MSQRLEKGSDLEQRIQEFFQLNGYGAERNVVREGRSGAPHEIDVLATRSDGVTDLTILVECKAWDSPIEKDVISKLSMEMSDLGVHKGIVVSLKGWTTGAELTAKQLGIELWGTEEIRNRLGQVAIAEISAGPSGRTGRGFGIKIKEPDLTPRLIATARGFLGFGREDLVWIKLLWVPFFFIELDHTKSRSTFLKGTVVDTTKRWNLYEGLSGRFFIAFETPPELTNVTIEHAVPARLQPRKLEREINDTIKKARTLVRQSSQTRYSNRLIELGVPGDTESTTVIRTETVHLAFFTGLLRSGDRYRLVAVDAVWGRRWRDVDAALSQNATYVTDTFGAEAGPEAAAAAAARKSSRPGLVHVLGLIAAGVVEYWVFGQNVFPVAYLVTIAALLFVAFQIWNREQGW